MYARKKWKECSLYVHIPFCVRKCNYCDFLSGPASEEKKETSIRALCHEREREAVLYPEDRIKTVFFGGGTPTVLSTGQLDEILCKLKEQFIFDKNEPEITLECNPGTIKGKSLKMLHEEGFNRLSIGLQSAREEELKTLGRIHSWKDFLDTYSAAREAGFHNINVDIMSALPGQSVESYQDTINKVLALYPEHVSAYSLMIEEGTPFYEQYSEADRERQKDGADQGHLLPTEEEERRMYELTRELLEKGGYHRYEISNYALPGYECRHNMVYWNRGNYLGLGLGATSLIENCRFTNTRNLEKYLDQNSDQYLYQYPGQCDNVMETNFDTLKDRGEGKSIEGNKIGGNKIGGNKIEGNKIGENRIEGNKIRENRIEGNKIEKADYLYHQEVQALTIQEQMEEFMFLGLRLTAGISCTRFQECFQRNIEDIYGEVLHKLEAQKLLVKRGDRILLTKMGVDVSNVVLAEFLL